MKREEEIAWQITNNLTTRIGTRLAGSGLFLAVTSFLIGGVLAVFAANQPVETALGNFLTNDSIKALWSSVFAALFLLGLALIAFLGSVREFRGAQGDINEGVNEAFDKLRILNISYVGDLEEAYKKASLKLTAGESRVRWGSRFLYAGLAISLLAFIIWATLLIWT